MVLKKHSATNEVRVSGYLGNASKSVKDAIEDTVESTAA